MLLTIEVCYVLVKGEQTKESSFLTQVEELLQLRQENQSLQVRLAKRAELSLIELRKKYKEELEEEWIEMLKEE